MPTTYDISFLSIAEQLKGVWYTIHDDTDEGNDNFDEHAIDTTRYGVSRRNVLGLVLAYLEKDDNPEGLYGSVSADADAIKIKQRHYSLALDIAYKCAEAMSVKPGHIMLEQLVNAFTDGLQEDKYVKAGTSIAKALDIDASFVDEHYWKASYSKRILPVEAAHNLIAFCEKQA